MNSRLSRAASQTTSAESSPFHRRRSPPRAAAAAAGLPQPAPSEQVCGEALRPDRAQNLPRARGAARQAAHSRSACSTRKGRREAAGAGPGGRLRPSEPAGSTHQ